jgi:signal transduction histidine kinase/ActR/RegA family two-component response regulator
VKEPSVATDAIPEPVAHGMTSGLTALDRARHGHASSVRVLVISGNDGGRVSHAAAAVGYTVTLVDVLHAARELEHRHHHVAIIDLPGLAGSGGGGDDALGLLRGTTPPTPALIVDVADDLATADRWIEAGADGYLCLSELGPPMLRGAVESAVSRNRARELRRRLEHADRLAAIGTLAAGVAHEVNNPASYVLMNLKSIREHLATLRDRRPPLTTDERALIDEMAEMLTDNLRGVERIVGVVHALRSYARTDPDEIERVDLAAVCREACDLVGNQLRQRARLRVDLAPTAPIIADARKLGQVVINLLVNAYDSLPVVISGHPGHEIRVRLVTSPGRIELSVSDTGVGIPGHLQTRIFEPFYTTKPRQDAAGLGLVVVRDIVERFGGRISVDSEPGHGSRFTVVFPSEDQVTVPAPAPSPAAAPPRARILIVDDEVALTSAMRRQLRRNHEVTVLNDGTAAMAAILEHEYDVILCDLMMPGADGMAVLDAVSQHRPELAQRMVLMTAGILQEALRERVHEAGAHVLDKPVPLDTLLTVIDAIRARAQSVPIAIDA